MSLELCNLDNFLIYLNLVKKMNQRLLVMCGIQTLELDAFSKYYYVLDEFSDAFFRITGFEFHKGTVIFSPKNGMNSLDFIRAYDDYENGLNDLLKSNYEVIDSLRVYRNKAQHEPHTIKPRSLFGANDYFQVSFFYERNHYKINSDDLCKLTFGLNALIAKLVDLFWQTLSESTKQLVWKNPRTESLLKPRLYEKYCELLTDHEKSLYVSLME